MWSSLLWQASCVLGIWWLTLLLILSLQWMGAASDSPLSSSKASSKSSSSKADFVMTMSSQKISASFSPTSVSEKGSCPCPQCPSHLACKFKRKDSCMSYVNYIQGQLDALVYPSNICLFLICLMFWPFLCYLHVFPMANWGVRHSKDIVGFQIFCSQGVLERLGVCFECTLHGNH